jgi:Raf kinase inhibitor-like YbhB/YbcL family protein
MAFQLFSSAFADGGWIPELHSCDGADISPPLEWTGAPSETRSFALVVEDPDAPNGMWCHWLLYDLGARIQALPQGYKPGALGVGGTNDFGKTGYGGPCPPRGHGAHRYFFRLSALKVDSLGLPPGAKRDDVVQAVKGQVLAEAQYMGRFERR